MKTLAQLLLTVLVAGLLACGAVWKLVEVGRSAGHQANKPLVTFSGPAAGAPR